MVSSEKSPNPLVLPFSISALYYVKISNFLDQNYEKKITSPFFLYIHTFIFVNSNLIQFSYCLPILLEFFGGKFYDVPAPILSFSYLNYIASFFSMTNWK